MWAPREAALPLGLCGPRGEAQALCASASSSGETTTVTLASALPVGTRNKRRLCDYHSRGIITKLPQEAWIILGSMVAPRVGLQRIIFPDWKLTFLPTAENLSAEFNSWFGPLSSKTQKHDAQRL